MCSVRENWEEKRAQSPDGIDYARPIYDVRREEEKKRKATNRRGPGVTSIIPVGLNNLAGEKERKKKRKGATYFVIHYGHNLQLEERERGKGRKEWGGAPLSPLFRHVRRNLLPQPTEKRAGERGGNSFLTSSFPKKKGEGEGEKEGEQLDAGILNQSFRRGKKKEGEKKSGGEEQAARGCSRILSIFVVRGMGRAGMGGLEREEKGGLAYTASATALLLKKKMGKKR